MVESHAFIYIAIGLGRKPVGGCYIAEMRRPAIRSTAHDPILSINIKSRKNFYYHIFVCYIIYQQHIKE